MRSLLIPFLLSALLAACSHTPVGPDYVLPAQSLAAQPAAAAQFNEAAKTAGASFTTTPLPPHWWRLYDDARLDELVQRALAHNTDLRQATANLEKVQAQADEAGAARGVSAALSGGPSFGHASGLSYLQKGYVPPNHFSASAGVALSYQLDLVGQLQRSIEAAEANTGAAEAGLDLARVSVVGATTRAYAQACSAGLRWQTAQHSVQLQREALDVAGQLQRAGRVGMLDLNRAKAQLEQLNAAMPPLQAEREAALLRLATLTGALPGDLPAGVADCAAPPQVMQALPVGDGAALLRRRPDVRQAERELAAATARIGVATGELYPHITLGLSASSAGPAPDFGHSDSLAWGLGPLISWTVPNTGAVQARIAQAEAGTRGALAKFDGTVLTALRETETALNAYARELDRRAALTAAREAAAKVAQQSAQLYRGGKTGYLDALDADRSLASADAALAASESQLADDQVQLFMALGGGWEALPASPVASVKP
ncbi:TolC family protein [Ideonella azotifigens]|uniref:Efflux transporter outer membrane subunit n=2 Tax=Ideonella azotifigens TaxID=513160 RepID=A0ABN1KJL7_9BURK|nr:TolC family protein [Ideonella azotifigens]MCD2339481.1 TolC family protein [Ideonella azotifigens]